MSIPKVSFSDLEEAFQNSSYEHHYWLDKQTGEVLFVDREIAQRLERGEDLSNVPKWQHELIEREASANKRDKLKFFWIGLASA
ncbi:MAG: hypothetical protein ABI977_00795, partial [Acidobacteriota bacterium]